MDYKRTLKKKIKTPIINKNKVKRKLKIKKKRRLKNKIK